MSTIKTSITIDARDLLFLAPNQLIVSCNGTPSHGLYSVAIKSGKTERIAGTDKAGYSDGLPLESSFDSPTGLCLSLTDGCIYVCDTLNQRIRNVSLPKSVSIIAWNECIETSRFSFRPLRSVRRKLKWI